MAKQPQRAQPSRPGKEPLLEQISSLVGFFLLLLVFKSFFLPLFVIPTGSMAETLCGAHATYTCPNCGYAYNVGFTPVPDGVECPNCRFPAQETPESNPRPAMRPTFGDRVFVLGWPYDLRLGNLGPRRWDVVVFRNPQNPRENFIKRLVGLPGEKIEIIDGDLFVNDQVQRKPRHVRDQLWFPYYDHDYRPREAGGVGADYLPHWAACTTPTAWQDLDQRVVRFAGTDAPRAALQFVTLPPGKLPGAPPVSSPIPPFPAGRINDVYGYNFNALVRRSNGEMRREQPYQTVSDVRLSARVRLTDGDGYVELSTTKYEHRFAARLYADGRVELLHGGLLTAPEDMILWQDMTEGLDMSAAHTIALGCSDYRVVVEVDGVQQLTRDARSAEAGESTAMAANPPFVISPSLARDRAARDAAEQNPVIQLAAAHVNAELSHIRIDRDIYYRGDPDDVRLQALGPDRKVQDLGAARATTGHPVRLGDDEYFTLGDNSPRSSDGRLWQDIGPHLALREDLQVGTIPADQLIGRAFFVYWPGFLPLPGGGMPIVPNLGQVRWIY